MTKEEGTTEINDDETKSILDSISLDNTEDIEIPKNKNNIAEGRIILYIPTCSNEHRTFWLILSSILSPRGKQRNSPKVYTLSTRLSNGRLLLQVTSKRLFQLVEGGGALASGGGAGRGDGARFRACLGKGALPGICKSGIETGQFPSWVLVDQLRSSRPRISRIV